MLKQHPTPVAIHPYIDSIAIWLEKKLSNKEFVFLNKYCGSKNFIAKKARFNSKLKYRLTVNQPQPEAYLLLDKVAERQLTCFNMVHVALDQIVHDFCEADYLQEYFDLYIVKLWHGKQKVNYIKNTRYTSKKRQVPNQIVIYSDLVSKVNGQPCTHIEWRVSGLAYVRNLNIYKPSDLINFNHREFWQKRLILEEVNVKTLGRQRNKRRHSKKTIPKIYSHGFGYADSDLHVGTLLSRSTPRERPEITSQSIRDAFSSRPWCRISSVMKRISNEPFLPREQ